MVFNLEGECEECVRNGGDMKGYGVWCKRAGNLELTTAGRGQEYCLVVARQIAKGS